MEHPHRGPRTLAARAGLTGERPSEILWATAAIDAEGTRDGRRLTFEPATLRIVSASSARWGGDGVERGQALARRGGTDGGYWAGPPLDEMDECAGRRDR